MPAPRVPTFPASPRAAMPDAPFLRSPSPACALLLGCLLSTVAGAEGPRGARESSALATDAPLREHEPGTPSPGRAAPPTYAEPEDVPLSSGAGAAHGALAVIPVAGVWGASRVGGDTRVAATASQTAAGMLLGALPSRLLFFRPIAPSPGRWMELETVPFGGGLVLTPPLAALGTWSLGELAFGRSQHPGRAYLGALGGAAVGTLLGVIAHEALVKCSRPSARGKRVRHLIALGFIGAGATLGYQWAGGGPRPDGPTQ